jgi:CRP-like cAMP-binding protein
MRLSVFLAKCPGLSSFDTPALERLAAGARTRTFSRHEALWRLGDTSSELLVVQRGLVKVTHWTEGGSGAVSLYGPAEDLEGFAAVRGGERVSTAVAVSGEVIVVAIPRALVLASHSELPGPAQSWAFDSTLQALGEWIDLLSARSVEARLAHLLARLHRRFGDDFEDGTSRIHLPLSRLELAELAATSPEAAIRVLSRWQREGLVTADSSGLTLRNAARLFALSGRNAAPAGRSAPAQAAQPRART